MAANDQPINMVYGQQPCPVPEGSVQQDQPYNQESGAVAVPMLVPDQLSSSCSTSLMPQYTIINASGPVILPTCSSKQSVILNSVTVNQTTPCLTAQPQMEDSKQFLAGNPTEAKTDGSSLGLSVAGDAAEQYYWEKASNVIKQEPSSEHPSGSGVLSPARPVTTEGLYIKAEQKSPAASTESTQLQQSADTYLLESLRTFASDVEPALGKVYIDTALDPTLGHVTPIGSLQLVPAADSQYSASASPSSLVKHAKQTARKSTTRKAETNKIIEQPCKKRGRPPKSKNKAKDSPAPKDKRKLKPVVKPGKKFKSCRTADTKLINSFVKNNRISIKGKVQLAARRPVVCLKRVQSDVVNPCKKYEGGFVPQVCIAKEENKSDSCDIEIDVKDTVQAEIVKIIMDEFKPESNSCAGTEINARQGTRDGVGMAANSVQSYSAIDNVMENNSVSSGLSETGNIKEESMGESNGLSQLHRSDSASTLHYCMDTPPNLNCKIEDKKVDSAIEQDNNGNVDRNATQYELICESHRDASDKSNPNEAITGSEINRQAISKLSVDGAVSCVNDNKVTGAKAGECSQPETPHKKGKRWKKMAGENAVHRRKSASKVTTNSEPADSDDNKTLKRSAKGVTRARGGCIKDKSPRTGASSARSSNAHHGHKRPGYAGRGRPPGSGRKHSNIKLPDRSQIFAIRKPVGLENQAVDDTGAAAKTDGKQDDSQNKTSDGQTDNAGEESAVGSSVKYVIEGTLVTKGSGTQNTHPDLEKGTKLKGGWKAHADEESVTCSITGEAASVSELKSRNGATGSVQGETCQKNMQISSMDQEVERQNVSQREVNNQDDSDVAENGKNMNTAVVADGSQDDRILEEDHSKASEIEQDLSHRRRSSLRVTNYAEFSEMSEDDDDMSKTCSSSDDWEEYAGIKKPKITQSKKSTKLKMLKGTSPGKRGRKKLLNGQSGRKVRNDSEEWTTPPVQSDSHEGVGLPRSACETHTAASLNKDVDLLSIGLMPNVNCSSFPCKMVTNSHLSKKCQRGQKKSKSNLDPSLPCVLKTVGATPDEQTSVYQCPICPHTLESTDDAGQHINEAHSHQIHFAMYEEPKEKAIPYIGCRHCDFIALNQLALWNHFAEYHNISGIKQEYEKAVIEKSGSYTQTRNRCKKCHHSVVSVFDIERHCILNHHEKILLFVCYSCSQFRTVSTVELIHHIKQHQISQLFSCTATIISADGVEERDLCNRKGGISVAVAPSTEQPAEMSNSNTASLALTTEALGLQPVVTEPDTMLTMIAESSHTSTSVAAAEFTSSFCRTSTSMCDVPASTVVYSQTGQGQRKPSARGRGRPPGSGRKRYHIILPDRSQIFGQTGEGGSNPPPSSVSNYNMVVPIQSTATIVTSQSSGNMVSASSGGAVLMPNHYRSQTKARHKSLVNILSRPVPVGSALSCSATAVSEQQMQPMPMQGFTSQQMSTNQSTSFPQSSVRPRPDSGQIQQQSTAMPQQPNQAVAPPESNSSSSLSLGGKEDAEYIISVTLVPLDKGSPIQIINKTQRWCEPVYQCALCPAEFDTAFKVPEHMKSKHANFMYTLALRSDSNCFLFCDHCNYITQNHTAMSLHFFDYHQVIGIMGRMGIRKNKASESGHPPTPNRTIHVCLHCSYKDKIRARMEQHSVKMHGTRFIAFRCMKCNFVNVRFGSFLRHNRDVHQMLPQFCAVILVDRARRMDTNIKHTEPFRDSKFKVSFSPAVTLPFLFSTVSLFGQGCPPELYNRQVPSDSAVGDVVVIPDDSTPKRHNSSRSKQKSSESGVTTIYLDESDSDNDIEVTAEFVEARGSNQSSKETGSPNKAARQPPSGPSASSQQPIAEPERRMARDDVIVIEDDIPARPKVQIIREYALPPTPPAGSAGLLMEVSED